MSNEIDGEDLNPILDAIDAAEDIPDPLDGLVEKSAEDPGAAFTPEVLERLVALKSEDRAAFEAWRAKLKKAVTVDKSGVPGAVSLSPLRDYILAWQSLRASGDMMVT